MFGHGQIEGYREKYGMEYRYSKWDEQVDQGLVHGHEWRIFPLIQRRSLFASVEDFHLYDFYNLDAHLIHGGGTVNEDVFAYSNKSGDERALVVYQNKYSKTSGWIKFSAASMDKASGNLVQKTLSEALSLPKETFTIFKDYVTGLEYIRSCREISDKGLFLELGTYQCHVFLYWRIVIGEQWEAVNHSIGGIGVPSVQAKFDELFAHTPEEENKLTVGKPRMRKTPQKPKAGKAAQKSSGEKTSGKTRKNGTAKKKLT
jgi:hypothetical protein